MADSQDAVSPNGGHAAEAAPAGNSVSRRTFLASTAAALAAGMVGEAVSRAEPGPVATGGRLGGGMEVVGLPHNARGEVNLTAYNRFLRALETRRPDDFEAIPLGCATPSFRRKLVNPQAGLAFDLEGADSHHLTQPPAPAFASAQEAGEIVEN